MVSVVIHSNPSLDNQRETAGWLKEGFKKHGLNAHITASKDAPGDVHVIQGPWYAYNEWLGKDNVLWLNRCFYGHPRWDVSIGWLKPDGTRDFCNFDMAYPNGDMPELKPMKGRTGKRACAMVFADYGQDPAKMIFEARNKYGRVYCRHHPADRFTTSPAMNPQWSLEMVWDMCDVAVGQSSTALVDAAINGLHVDCPDSHVCADIHDDRQLWLTDLSWAQWHYTQVQSGEFWEHLNEG
jgi:hypothetical protein